MPTGSSGSNAFWHARLDGLFTNYRAVDGLVEPISGGEDLPREQQQLLILYAGLDIVLTELRNAQSAFRAKAGPVEYETQQSAPLLREVLNTLKSRIAFVIGNLTSYAGEVQAFDSVIARTESILYQDTWWVR